MKKLNKLTASLLSIIMVFSLCIVSASAKSTDNSIYGARKTEVVNIEGVNYTYHYCYTDGMKTIEITKENSKVTDKLTYNESNSTIYLNDEIMGTIKNVTSISRADSNSVNYDYGEYMGSYSQYITWASAAPIVFIAGALALALPFAGASAAIVVATMGAGTLSIIAALCIGGTVSGSWYRSISPISIVDTNVWSFTAWTGESFGPYVNMYAV